MQLPETNCARARESVSAQLDDELTESELDRLEAHLLVCPECSAWAEDVELATRRLRAASLEAPLESYRVARRGRRLAGARLPAVAATVAAASVAAMLAVNPGRLEPSVSSRHSALGSGRARLMPQNRLVRLDGGFLFGVRTLPESGRLEPS